MVLLPLFQTLTAAVLATFTPGPRALHYARTAQSTDEDQAVMTGVSD